MSRRQLQAGTLVLASHNSSKVAELKELLNPFGIEIVPAADLQLPEPEETGPTFLENARIKAQAAAKQAGCPALGDDSGLEVNALGGEPGILSARWAGEARNFRAAMKRVLDELRFRQIRASRNCDRSARFVCALVVAWPEGHCEMFEGAVEGEITDRPYGGNGFGYDPIFRPQGSRSSFGEMDAEQKKAVSHRTRAFRALLHACLRDFSPA